MDQRSLRTARPTLTVLWSATVALALAACQPAQRPTAIAVESIGEATVRELSREAAPRTEGEPRELAQTLALSLKEDAQQDKARPVKGTEDAQQDKARPVKGTEDAQQDKARPVKGKAGAQQEKARPVKGKAGTDAASRRKCVCLESFDDFLGDVFSQFPSSKRRLGGRYDTIVAADSAMKAYPESGQSCQEVEALLVEATSDVMGTLIEEFTYTKIQSKYDAWLATDQIRRVGLFVVMEYLEQNRRDLKLACVGLGEGEVEAARNPEPGSRKRSIQNLLLHISGDASHHRTLEVCKSIPCSYLYDCEYSICCKSVREFEALERKIRSER
jgi:hypothetical protein